MTSAPGERFTASEARRLKAFLGLEDGCGLEGLARALPLKLTSPCNETEIRWEGDELVFRVISCRVQAARVSQGHEPPPLQKPVGLVEYSAGSLERLTRASSAICDSCYPDVADDTCACAWRFRIGQRGRLRRVGTRNCALQSNFEAFCVGGDPTEGCYWERGNSLTRSFLAREPIYAGRIALPKGGRPTQNVAFLERSAGDALGDGYSRRRTSRGSRAKILAERLG